VEQPHSLSADHLEHEHARPGWTKDVIAKAKAQVAGGRIEIAGSVATAMGDFQVSPPQAPFVTVDPAVTLELDIFLTKAA
jgi:hypothetical protein